MYSTELNWTLYLKFSRAGGVMYLEINNDDDDDDDDDDT